MIQQMFLFKNRVMVCNHRGGAAAGFRLPARVCGLQNYHRFKPVLFHADFFHRLCKPFKGVRRFAADVKLPRIRPAFGCNRNGFHPNKGRPAFGKPVISPLCQFARFACGRSVAPLHGLNNKSVFQLPIARFHLFKQNICILLCIKRKGIFIKFCFQFL